MIECDAKEREAKLAAIAECAGALTGAFDPDYLGQLRDEWPA